MKSTRKRRVCFVLVILICLLSAGTVSAAGSSGNKITVSFRLIGAEKAKEDVDLGTDPYLPAYVTWIPTVEYELNAGATVYDLWLLATGNAGIRSIGADRDYVKTVYAPDSLGGYALSEFTNGKRSGWMYTVNGSHPGYGLKQQHLRNGDTVVWHYVSDYSYEVSDWYSEGSWQALGDGTYYDLWQYAPDRLGGISLAVTGIHVDKTSAKEGDTITWTVNAIGSGKTLRYCFYVYKDGAVIQKGSYGTARSYSYTIPGAGQYSIKAFVKDGTGNATSKVGASVNVSSAVPLTITTVKANKASALIGDTVTWTAGVTGGSGAARCCFYVFKDGKIAERGSYGTAKTYSYTISSAGTYTVRVYAKEGSGTAIQLTGGNVTVAAPISITDVTANKTAAAIGDTITWTASTVGGSGTARYCFYVFKDGKIAERGSYGAAKMYSYTINTAGIYTVRVYGKDGSSAAIPLTGGAVTVSSEPLSITDVTVDKTVVKTGVTITWTASASGISGAPRYCFYVYKDGAVVHKGSYGPINTFSYSPTVSGSYTVKAFVKDSVGNAVSKTCGTSVNVQDV